MTFSQLNPTNVTGEAMYKGFVFTYGNLGRCCMCGNLTHWLDLAVFEDKFCSTDCFDKELEGYLNSLDK